MKLPWDNLSVCLSHPAVTFLSTKLRRFADCFPHGVCGWRIKMDGEAGGEAAK